MKKGVIIAIIVAAVLIVPVIFMGIIALIAVPNLTSVQDRSQVNADIRTAEQIGKSIVIWRVDGKNREVPTTVTEYNKLENIDEYTYTDSKPNSLEEGEFYVVSDNGTIKIAIAKEASEVSKLEANDMYEGSGAGWAYVEGQY